MFYSDRKTAELLSVTGEEYPMGVQLFGSEPDIMAAACKKAAKFSPQFIDINMGCPVQKVVSTGSGSALMKTPQLAADIVKACVDAVDLPVTVKIRKGFDNDNINAVELACAPSRKPALAPLQCTGAPTADVQSTWILLLPGEAGRIHSPVIGNGGDITTPQRAAEMYQKPDATSVISGVAAMGILDFEEVSRYLERRRPCFRRKRRRAARLCWSISASSANSRGTAGNPGIQKACRMVRKGMRGAAKFRNACGQLASYEDVVELAKRVKAENRLEEE